MSPFGPALSCFRELHRCGLLAAPCLTTCRYGARVRAWDSPTHWCPMLCVTALPVFWRKPYTVLFSLPSFTETGQVLETLRLLSGREGLGACHPDGRSDLEGYRWAHTRQGRMVPGYGYGFITGRKPPTRSGCLKGRSASKDWISGVSDKVWRLGRGGKAVPRGLAVRRPQARHAIMLVSHCSAPSKCSDSQTYITAHLPVTTH